MNFLNLMAGVLLIGWGRNMFWLFVAWLGFATGFQLAQSQLNSSGPLTLIFALAAGICGALIAYYLEKFAVGLAGFVAGGFLTFQLAAVYFPEHALVFSVIGALVGTIMMYALFDGALIFFTALAGAGLVVNTLNLNQGLYLFAIIALTFAGIFLQTNIPHLPGNTHRPRMA